MYTNVINMNCINNRINMNMNMIADMIPIIIFEFALRFKIMDIKTIINVVNNNMKLLFFPKFRY